MWVELSFSSSQWMTRLQYIIDPFLGTSRKSMSDTIKRSVCYVGHGSLIELKW